MDVYISLQLPQYTLYGLSICSNKDLDEELFDACKDGHVGVVRNAIRKGANVNLVSYTVSE